MSEHIVVEVGTRIWRPVIHAPLGKVTIPPITVYRVNKTRVMFRAQQGRLRTKCIHMACEESGLGGIVCFAPSAPETTGYFEVVKLLRGHALTRPVTCSLDEVLGNYHDQERIGEFSDCIPSTLSA